MAGTYSQLYIHVVFAVKGRENHLRKEWREEIFQYISGIITKKEQKSIIVNGVADHVHILVGLSPSMKISDLVRDIKNNSTNFINSKNFLKSEFKWQEGYGAFSYSQTHVQSVYKYILKQEQHHEKQSFKEEYLEMLKKFEVDYNEKYLFEWD
jgi:REP element-mobilizing transposase RayT